MVIRVCVWSAFHVFHLSNCVYLPMTYLHTHTGLGSLSVHVPSPAFSSASEGVDGCIRASH